MNGPPSIPNALFQMISWLPPSSDGIDEYRSNTFQGQIRGRLISQKYQQKLRRVNAPVLGVVLNQLDLEKAEKYYGEYSGYKSYKGYKKYGYSKAYGSPEG